MDINLSDGFKLGFFDLDIIRPDLVDDFDLVNTLSTIFIIAYPCIFVKLSKKHTSIGSVLFSIKEHKEYDNAYTSLQQLLSSIVFLAHATADDHQNLIPYASESKYKVVPNLIPLFL